MTKNIYTFADLFAGIGGMRYAFERHGYCECVFSSEINKHAQTTYMLNFPENKERADHIFNDNILNILTKNIPDHDILLAGFPCQPYSIAGLRKGLNDERGGDIFKKVIDILQIKKPKAFLLENVRGMLNHDQGRTINYMVDELKGCGYQVLPPTILNSSTHANVPQNRERVFVVGFMDPSKASTFIFPPKIALKKTIHDCLEVNQVDSDFYYTDRFGCYEALKDEIKSRDTIYQWRRMYVRENKSNACPTLTANMGSGGHNVPLIKDEYGIRKLTPQETANFQGFPNKHKLPDIANSHLYHQFGNSVTVPLIKKLANKILKALQDG